MSRPRTAAEQWIAEHPLPEPTIPAGHVPCPACHTTGTKTYGYHDGQPIEDDCTTCWRAGYVPAEAVHPLRPDLATPTAGAL